MLQSSEIPSLSTSGAAVDNERALAKYIERYTKRQLFGRYFLTASLLVDLAAYKTPIAVEELRLASTEPALIQVSESSSDPLAETIIVGGYGIKDATPIAEALPQLSEIGAVSALEQDNKGIDSHVIAEMIMEQAKEQGLEEIGLWGDSNGGLLVTEVAREIQEDDSPLRVQFIVLDCTPTSVSALRPDDREHAAVADFLTNGWVSLVIPDAINHPLVSYIYDQGQAANLAQGSSNQTESAPSKALLVSQGLLVVDNSLAEDLKAIGKNSDKQPPLIISIRPVSETADAVVDSDYASKELRQMAQEANLELLEIKLPDIIHGDPTVNRQQYQQAISNIILPALDKYETPLVQPPKLFSTK